VAPTEIAIFYRTNAQSRVLEETLRMGRIPYTIVRGRSFYDRAEVRDAVSYLRIALNPRSDADLLRVINTPPRGIGGTTVERLTDHAQARGVCLFDSLASVDFAHDINSGARKRLQQFREVVQAMRSQVEGQQAAEAMQSVLDASGMIEELEVENTAESEARIENLRELVSAAREFDETYVAPDPASLPVDPETGPLVIAPEPLAAFLEQISLVGEADVAEGVGRVSMMTLHAAKGLEFDCVFLTGMEENVFPHSRATKEGADPEELAEERRLCYVGITRARKRLFLSMAQSRSLFGELRFNRPSRFLAEIPRELFAFGPGFDLPATPGRQVMPATPPVRRAAPPGERVVYDEEQYPLSPYSSGGNSRVARRQGPRADALGERVQHEMFGEGEVQSRDGAGDDANVQVYFQTVGLKKIKARFLRPA